MIALKVRGLRISLRMRHPLALPHVCAKCGSHRTRVTGATANPPGEFVRCEACGHCALITGESYAFRLPVVCAKCGSRRLRSVGTSTASSDIQYYRCDACEHLMTVKSGCP